MKAFKAIEENFAILERAAKTPVQVNPGLNKEIGGAAA